MNQRKAIAFAGFAFVLVLAIALATQAATITTGLVGRWIFSDGYGITALDSSGQGHNGTISGAAQFITTDPQKGSVLNIYKASGIVTYPYAATMQPVAGTVCLWVKPAVAELSDIVRLDTNLLVRTSMAGNYYAYDLRVTSSGQLNGILANDDPTTGKKQPQITASTPAGAVPVGQWTHIAMEWDGIGTFYLFVNGKQAGKGDYYPNPTEGLSYHGQYPVQVAAANYEATKGYLEYTGNLERPSCLFARVDSSEIIGIATNGE